MKWAFWRRDRGPYEPLRAIVHLEGASPSHPAVVPGRIPLALKIDSMPEIRHVIEHKPRPAPPRPERITVVYEMQNGSEIRTYIPLHGQAVWSQPWPSWLNPDNPCWPPVSIRYHLGYSDSGY